MSFDLVSPVNLIIFQHCLRFDSFVLQLLRVNPEEVLIESTGVIGHRIKKVQHIFLFFSVLVLR